MSSATVRASLANNQAAPRGILSQGVPSGVRRLLEDDPTLTLEDVLYAALAAYVQRDDSGVRVTLRGPRHRWWKRAGKEVA